MNARHFFSQPKTLAATALLALTGVANAGGVQWSVGVNAPIVGPGQIQAVVSNGHRYYAPQPVVYYQQPTPVLVQPRYYAPRPVVYVPAPAIAVRPGHRWHHHHRHQRAEAYAYGYGQGYEQGYERGYRRGDDRDDDRRGNWGRRD